MQSELARHIVLKYTPQLVFHQDNSIERGVRVIDILQKIEIPASDHE
jgi:ribosome-binding factor A